MDKSKYYATYRFDNGTTYKAEVGKDGVTENDMHNLRKVIKSVDKANAKAEKFDMVSIEAMIIDADKQYDFVDDADVELIIETADEYAKLHCAIERLLPQQQELINKIYFEDMSMAEIARDEGVYESAIRNRLNKIFKKLKLFLK